MKKITLLLCLFLTGMAAQAQTLSNTDFEDWDITPYDDPATYWISSNYVFLPELGVVTTTRVTGQGSPNAIRLQTHKVGSDVAVGFITNTLEDIEAGVGGQPYTGQPTHMDGFYRYNLPADDTAILMAIFKNSGIPISINIFKIKGTGNQPVFIPFSFALSPLPIAPDTVIIAALSSSILGGDDSKAEDGSWIEFDNLMFSGSGAMPPIPNGNFEAWRTRSFETPNDWTRGDGFSWGIEPTIKRSTDKYSGSYALKLITSVDSFNNNFIEIGSVFANMGISVTVPDTIIGYYKYTTPGIDTATVTATFLNSSGFPAGVKSLYILPPVATYTRFALPIDPDDIPSGSTSVTLSFESSAMMMPTTGAPLDPVPGSTLLIDNLSVVQGSVGVGKLKLIHNYNVYPNPVKNVLNISLKSNGSEEVAITLVDAKGSVVYKAAHKLSGGSNIAIPVSQLAPGMYFYTIKGSNGIATDKFYKE